MKITYLAIQGNRTHDYILDIVDDEGATVRHLVVPTGPRAAAEAIAARVIAGDSLMLASLGLPIGNYELVIHAAYRRQKDAVAIIREAQKAREARELAELGYSPCANLVAKHQERADAHRARLTKTGYRPR